MIYLKKNKINKAIYGEIILKYDIKINNGLPHLLEHLIMKYNSVYPTETIRKLRSLYEIEAQTYADYISFSFYTTKRNFCKAINFLSNLIYHLKISNKAFFSEKKIILDEMKSALLDHESINYVNVMKKITNLEDFNILGDESNFNNLKLDDLKTFYKKIVAAPVDIYLNGNISKIKVDYLCKRLFNCFEKNVSNFAAISLNKPQMNIGQHLTASQFILNYAFPIILNPTIKIECFMRNLQYFCDIIMNKIYKDENQILYNFDTNYIIYHNVVIFYFSFHCCTENYTIIDKLFPSILEELKNLESKDLEDLTELIKDSLNKYVRLPNEKLVYENIKNYNKLYTEEDFLKIRLKKGNAKEFKIFVNSLLNNRCSKIITPIY